MLIHVPSNSKTESLLSEDGWTEDSTTLICKMDHFLDTSADLTTLHTPVIVSGVIRRPFIRFQGKSLASAILLKSISRELLAAGAISKSVVALRCLSSILETAMVDGVSIEVAGKPCRLRILGPNFLVENNEYVSLIQGMFERLDPALDIHNSTRSADFWWDVANHTMFSFDRNFLARVPEHLMTSFAKL